MPPAGTRSPQRAMSSLRGSVAVGPVDEQQRHRAVQRRSARHTTSRARDGRARSRRRARGWRETRRGPRRRARRRGRSPAVRGRRRRGDRSPPARRLGDSAEARMIVERPRNEPISTIRPPGPTARAASYSARACASVSQPWTPSTSASARSKPFDPVTRGARRRPAAGAAAWATTSSVIDAARSQVNVSARSRAAAPSRSRSSLSDDQLADLRCQLRGRSSPARPVCPSTIDSRRPPTASAALGVPHSAASITVSDQPSDADAVMCSHACLVEAGLGRLVNEPVHSTPSPEGHGVRSRRSSVSPWSPWPATSSVTPGSSISMSSSNSIRL